MKKLTSAELMTLANEAQHSTLLAIMWSSSAEGFTSAKQLGAYFLKWVDATKAALEILDNQDNQEKLVQDLATIIITPLAGTRAALHEYAKTKGIALPKSTITGKEDAIEFKKLALAEIEANMKILEGFRQSKEKAV